MSNEVGEWYRSIPQITRYWFTLTVAFPLIGKLGLVSFQSMALDYYLCIHKFQLWRLITSLFYYPLVPQTGFHFLINLFFLYSYSTRLETGKFDGRPADYLFMLIFNWLCLIIVGFIAGLTLLLEPMVLSVLYVWCQLNRDTIVSFWFGMRFKAMYLPWVLFGFNFILRGGGFDHIIGILVGHLYFFLMFMYPQDYGGRQFLGTPQFLYKYFPNRRGGVSGFGVAPAARPAAEDNRAPADGNQRHNWGQGNALGQ